MTQDVADLLERHRRAKEAHGAGMTEGMRSLLAGSYDTCGVQTSSDDFVERRPVRERAIRCIKAQGNYSPPSA